MKTMFWALILALTLAGCGSDGSTGGSNTDGGAGQSSGGTSGGGGTGGTGGTSGTGGGGGAPVCPGITATTLAELNGDELALLCDCAADAFGGYGKQIECTGGTTVKSKASQQECVSSFDASKPSCTATVSQALTCASDTAACKLSSSACSPLFGCAP